MRLQSVEEIHAEDSPDDSTRAQSHGSNLQEETHPDHAVPHAVKMSPYELVGVLDHLLEGLDLRLDFLEVSTVGLQQQLNVYVVVDLPVPVSEVETHQVLVIGRQLSHQLQTLANILLELRQTLPEGQQSPEVVSAGLLGNFVQQHVKSWLDDLEMSLEFLDDIVQRTLQHDVFKVSLLCPGTEVEFGDGMILQKSHFRL